MKKKVLFTLTLAFVMVFNIFSGCSFTETNTSKYYNTVVAKIGDDIEITKYELLNSYNDYGYQYVESSGYTTEKALETVLDQLINREVLAKYITENYYTLFNEAQLKDWEISEIWEDVFEYVNNNEFLEYVNSARKHLGMTEISAPSNEEETNSDEESKVFIREAYKKEIVVTQDPITGLITKITPTLTIHNENLKLTINDFRYSFFGETSSINDRINLTAQSRHKIYLKDLMEDEKVTDEKAILHDHLNKLFDSYKKTYLITKFKEQYQGNSEISINSIINKYKELVNIDKQKYSDVANKAAYISAVQSDASKIYYHPYENELIYVSHILVKYDKNNDDLNLKTVYKTQYENGEIATKQEYEEKISDLSLGTDCKVYEMIDGSFTNEPTNMNANDLYSLVKSELNPLTSNEQKLNKFIDLAYKYNQDTAMFNSSDFYTIQLDTTYSDTMVTEFADLSRKLYNEEGVGSVGICFTQYGAHIIYIVGKVENKIADTNNVTVDQLNNVKLLSNQYLMSDAQNANIDKTLLDVIADMVKIDNYDSYVAVLLNDVKSDLGKEIVIYKNRYKDMYN